MGLLGNIWRKAINHVFGDARQWPQFPAANHPSLLLPPLITPFEALLKKEYEKARECGRDTLIVALRPNPEGDIVRADARSGHAVRYEYFFFSNLKHGQAKAQIDHFNEGDRPVVLALQVSPDRTIEQQFPDWLCGTIHSPGIFLGRPLLMIDDAPPALRYTSHVPRLSEPRPALFSNQDNIPSRFGWDESGPRRLPSYLQDLTRGA